MRDMVARPRALRLLQAYDEIDDRRIAAAVLALVETLASATPHDR